MYCMYILQEELEVMARKEAWTPPTLSQAKTALMKVRDGWTQSASILTFSFQWHFRSYAYKN